MRCQVKSLHTKIQYISVKPTAEGLIKVGGWICHVDCQGLFIISTNYIEHPWRKVSYNDGACRALVREIEQKAKMQRHRVLPKSALMQSSQRPG